MCINESLLTTPDHPPPFSRHRHSGFDRGDFDQRHRGRDPLGLLSPEHDGRPLAHRTSAEEAQDQDDVLEEQRCRGVGGHGRIPGSRGGRRGRRRRSRGNVQLRLRRDLATAGDASARMRSQTLRCDSRMKNAGLTESSFFSSFDLFYQFVGLDF